MCGADLQVFPRRDRSVSGIRIKKEVFVGRDMPNFRAISFFDRKKPEETISRLDLENEKIARLKIL